MTDSLIAALEKATTRQLKFLRIAAEPNGFWVAADNPILANSELTPIRGFVYVDETDPRYGAVWRVNDAGRAALKAIAAQRGGG